ncbi:MAG: enoyl-CoA hydratase-related protein [Chloroflexota bacterium]
MSGTVLYTEKGHVARITLNRPRAGNVINRQLTQELIDICSEIGRNDGIHAVILTGAGSRAFCAGSECERVLQRSQISSAEAKDCSQYNVAKAIADIEKPVIAAINGDALGEGLELALSCDIRLTVPKAKFGFPQVSSGLIPMDGGTQRLPRIVGRSKALEMIFTGETISAGVALEISLVSKVVTPANLIPEVESMAETMAGKAPIALRFIKEAVNKGLDLTMEQGLRLEADLYFLLHTTADRTEGIHAFLEKRSPQFKGQ